MKNDGTGPVITESTALSVAVAAVRPDDLQQQQADDERKRQAAEKNLWWWNLSMAILHLFQAVAVVAAGATVTRLKNFKLPLLTTFVSWELGYPQTVLKQRDQLSLVPITSIFAFMSSAAHLIVLLCWRKYTADLRKGRNAFRWIEYAFSSTLMICLIAALFGVWSITELIAIGGCNAAMCLFGLCMERQNGGKPREEVDWVPFIAGCFAGGVPWVIICAYFGGIGSGNIPGFVYAIFFVYLAFFQSFAVNMILQYLQVGRWSDKVQGWRGGGYYYGERVYQIMSLVAKSFLLWLVVGGANQPNQFSGSQ